MRKEKEGQEKHKKQNVELILPTETPPLNPKLEKLIGALSANVKKELLEQMSNIYFQGYVDGFNSVTHPKVIDDVKLGEQGWKERYYRKKFGLSGLDDVDGIRKYFFFIIFTFLLDWSCVP